MASAKYDYSGLFEEGQVGCKIKLAEERAITLTQLQGLVKHIYKQCSAEQWVDIGEYSPTRGKLLTPVADPIKQDLVPVNLYHILDIVIKPGTRGLDCSYVELVAKQPQIPKWFVSHFWGESVALFVMCIEQHRLDRGLSLEDCWWVCAYANKQWNVTEEVSDDPELTSFRRAIALSEGTVSILDPRATCYTRVWCCFEIFVTLEIGDGQQLYDIYTVVEDSDPLFAVGICDGFAEADKVNGMGNAPHVKMVRESKFPMSIAKDVMAVNLHKASATVHADKVHILNKIVGNPNLNEEPPEEHENYHNLNHKLAGHFAYATWRLALEAGEPMEMYCNMLARSKIRELHFSLGGCAQFTDQAATELSQSLPDTTEILTVALGTTPCGDRALVSLGEAFGRMKCLRELRIKVRDKGFHREFSSEAFAGLVRNLRTDFLTELQLIWNSDFSPLINLLGKLSKCTNFYVNILTKCEADAFMVVIRALPPGLLQLGIEGGDFDLDTIRDAVKEIASECAVVGAAQKVEGGLSRKRKLGE